MKKNICIVILFYICFNIYGQDPVKSYPGIPIISHDFLEMQYTPPLEQFQQADSAGIFIMLMGDLTKNIYNTRIASTNLLIVPERDVETGENPIKNYTDARYTVFEAEGTPPADGLVTLYNDSLGDYLDRVNGYVSTKSNTPHGTMIYGPMYRQCRNYFTTGRSLPIDYQAKYILKLEDLPPQNSSPDDTVCILQVTATRTWKDSLIIHNGDTLYYQSFGGFYDTKIVKDSVLRYRDFINIGQPQDFIIDYKFTTDFPWWRPNELVGTSVANIKSDADTGKISQNCVEFKVLWRGKADKVKISVDKVIVSDQRGRDLKNPIEFNRIKRRIEDQIDNNSAAFNNRVGAFMGIDEPWSIDQWEPIRIVNEIIDAHSPSAKLYINFNVQEDGRFGKWQDPAPGSHAIVIDEFMRRVKKANLWVTGWLYDLPCNEGAYLPPCDTVSDYKSFNIRIFADSVYKRILETSKQFPGLFYGLSVQTGKYQYSTEYRIREINSIKILYQTNLTLLYGAKILFPWLYFGNNNGIGNNFTGFRNVGDSYAITDKYLMLRDTIAPRLRGLMGKTLKTLTPSTQHLDINTQGNYNFISHFSGNLECLPVISHYDLGFFTDSLSRDYFMVISRYYNTEGACPIFINLDEGCVYNNLVLTKYVADTTYNILRTDAIRVNLTRGDAELYRIYPVVRWGGSLLANDTTNAGETLHSDMVIENNATLVINGTYYANANITVKAGGKIKYGGNNSKIVFGDGKKLIVEGTAEIKGTSSSNKLTLEFLNTEKGLDVMPGSSLTINYCNITGAYYGLVTRTGTPGYLNITNSNFAFGLTGIVLNGNFYGEGSGPSPTSTISNCNFTTSGTGISVTNNSSVIISQNNFTSCGISILNVPAAYIQGNNISAGTNTSNPGIFFNNSGGYIRSNIIKNRVNGIHIANSSPDVGGNILEDNYKHGLYIGSGSIPNLVGYIQANPPLYFPLRGYNTIRNNGINPVPGTENDGSEIYLSSANISLRDGCNQIVDDRQNPPNTNTILLINGSLAVGGGRQLDARNNYWGTITPTSSRFGSLSVLFTPYYGSPCPIPDGGSGGEESFALTTPNGEVIDTIKSAEGTPEELTALEANYSEADKLFATGNAEQSKTIYEQTVNSSCTTEEKLPAYNKLYTIGNLLGLDENYFSSLQNTFENISVNETDTLLKSIYNQNAIKCDVSKEEYLTAISKFDNIIQQNPNSEEAVYAEIDIITTALNLDTTNTQLGKMGGGKYLVKGTTDYLTKLNNLLKDKFGINTEEKEKIVPKEYSLHQNYPNPFNPITTIKFDLPNDGTITLEIFDILGRKISTLVDEYKPAGSYEQVFNASSLASGVYVYKLQAGDFVDSKKMMLIK